MEIKCFNVFSQFSSTSVYTVMCLVNKQVYEGLTDRIGEAMQIWIISQCFMYLVCPDTYQAVKFH